MSFVWVGCLGLAGLLACGKTGEQGNKNQAVAVKQPADSLVLTNGAGVEIWFTLAREANGADGAACVERGLEIRRANSRVNVPLLYTGTAPVLLNDSTMRAILWTHCTPGDAYLVNLRSGHPVRERAEPAS